DLTPGGMPMQETPGAFADAGAFIRMRIVTAWLQFAGIQGFQRVYKALLLGRYLSPHKLRVQVAYDFDPTPVQEDYVQPVPAGTYGGGSLYGGGTSYGGMTMYEWRIFLAKQKCAAVQFTIEDVSTGTAGESMSLSALGLEVGLKGRLQKLPAASSVG